MESHRTESFYWGALGVVVTVVCIWLTRLITHIDHNAVHEIGVAFEAVQPRDVARVTIGNLEARRFAIPVIAPTDYNELLFIITPGTRSVTVYGAEPFEMSCAYVDEVRSAAALPTFVALVRNEQLTPIVDHAQAVAERLSQIAGLDAVVTLATRHVWSISLPVPPSLRAKLDRAALAQAVIRCSFAKPIVASPTFTARSVIIALPDVNAGTVAVDMAAFDGIDDVRFGAGITNPNQGVQVRILDTKDRLVRIEWADEAALEQRDIILVLIGGLAAVAAAMFIESMRPAVKRRAPGDGPAP